MEFKDKRGLRRLGSSFVYAFRGLVHAAAEEQNVRLHLCAAFLVMCTGFFLNIPKYHWLILLLTVGAVLALEIMNTAIERTVDLVTDQYHPLAKAAKDLAAAAVFVFTIISVIIGLIIFLPPILKLL
ncbi:diacylglycerol kinase family protein [Alteribacillus sp. HJP-4]|uniref:diacylglycerol kinase family protein n=1 Tax=Alteribacillus sp. HJP-4 TaxID=2775394 RepID=UPI0035CCF4E9